VANRQHFSFPVITGVYMYHSDIRLETSESQQETEQAAGIEEFQSISYFKQDELVQIFKVTERKW